MAAQISYELSIPVAYPGLIYAQFPSEIQSFLVETVAGIPFGVAVSRGTDAEEQIVIGGSVFVGITIRSLDREGAANTGDIQYNVTEAAGVMRAGYIYVTCPTGCVPTDVVKYNTTTGVIDSGAPGGGELAIANATWETNTAAGQIGVIRLPS